MMAVMVTITASKRRLVQMTMLALPLMMSAELKATEVPYEKVP
jgi:hypothetical protein